MRFYAICAAIALTTVAPSAQAQSVYEGRIDGDYEGWDGETVYKMQDGHIIQQASYYYHYHYAYSPAVIIFKTSQGLMIKVDGDSHEPVRVNILK